VIEAAARAYLAAINRIKSSDAMRPPANPGAGAAAKTVTP
jgi:hypothetical protein